MRNCYGNAMYQHARLYGGVSRTASLLLAVVLIGAGCDVHRPRHPNVVLISIDSLRADHVGALGYSRPTTPTIDSLAAAGSLFTRAYSTTSWTLPAHAALLTGLPDSAHGVTLPRHVLREELVTLTEVLREAGYRTVGFYSGPFLHPIFGFGQGFEQYVDCTSNGLDKLTSIDSWNK